MRDPWVHVGRLWTNGETFLAVDAALRGAWHGASNEDFEEVILDAIEQQDTSIPVGTGRALLVGADGAVNDDSWMEIFATETGIVAIVQASGPDYPEALARALGYPNADDLDGDTLKAPSGEIAIFSAALDGTGPDSGPWASARSGPVPPVYLPYAYGHPTPPSILLPAPHAEYKLKIRWCTSLYEDTRFARWLLIPTNPSD
jgi:hypothetical protein